MSRKLLLFLVAVLLAGAGYYLGARQAGSAPDAAPVAAPAPATPAPAGEASAAPRARAARAAATATSARSEPLPPADAPLADTFAELRARSVAGDAAAASRLYRDLSRCWRAPDSQREHEVRAAAMLQMSEGRSRRRFLDIAEGSLQRAEAWTEWEAALCADLDPAVFAELTPSLLRAAQLGDHEASLCYLQYGPALDAGGLLAHPEYLETYAREAPGLLDAALAEHDWRLVQLLADAYGSREGSLLSGLVGQDPEQYYRYLRLLQLGLDEQPIPYMDAQLAARVDYAGRALDDTRRVAAEVWAGEQRAAFATSADPRTLRRSQVCAVDPDRG